ncbi:MAG: cobyrinic acid a,c-diamide synthase [Rickettsiales bacterium]|nr:cobyrinic acid a,c-diamide synthase [Rickettsiales bacterium]
MSEHPTPPKNIIAIASGKGGVGKTWFAITLAHLFARSGRRTLLFDGDIGLANVDVQLGLTPKQDLSSVFYGKNQLKDVICHYDGGNFDILAGRSGSTSLSSLSMSRLTAIREDLTAMAETYDYVLIDLGAGIEQNVQFLASIASKCIVLVNDEPTSLTDAYAFIKLCVTRPNMPKVEVVVNMAASQKEGEKTFGALSRACTNFLHFSPPCLGIIRKDNKVKDAIRSQMTLLEKSSHTTAATDAAAISIKLMQEGRKG